MDPSIQLLFDEHDIIVKALGHVKSLNDLLPSGEEEYLANARVLLAFFRDYGDKFHHHKEEVILFPEMEKKNEILGMGVLQEMLENHADFRLMLKEVEQHLDKKEHQLAQRVFERYSEALLDHIAVENDEVFQMAEALFNPQELDRIYYQFQDCDRELGTDKKLQLAKQLDGLRKETNR